MGVLDRLAGAKIGSEMGAAGFLEFTTEIRETIANLETQIEDQGQESAIDAEMAIAQDDKGWIGLTESQDDVSITRDNLRRATATARLMYLLNPLMKRAVTVQELYVWGSGCEIKAADPTVNEVLHDCFSDPKNQSVIGQAWPERERSQRVDGNTFFLAFRNKVNGRVRWRLLPFDEVEDIILNPEDSKEPWFYLRATVDDENGSKQFKLYPDINYTPLKRPKSIKVKDEQEVLIEWDVPCMHVSTGGLPGMKFGLTELQSVIPWAKGYKRFLENFATIIQAYARIAMKITGLANKNKTAAARSKLNTSIVPGSTRETNPPNTTAAWMATSGNVDISPVKTAGSTTGPDEARALRSMVASGTDTPEHFFGDSDIGNFATSSTLDRPTELKMISRQGMWAFVQLRMCRFIIESSARAPKGKLKIAGFEISITRDGFDGQSTMTVTAPGKESLHVTATFPTILERDVIDRVRAVVMAATLNGSPAEGIIPDRKQVYKLLLTALGEKDAEYLTNLYYPSSVLQGFKDPGEQAKLDKVNADAKADLGKAAIIAANAQNKKAEQPPAPIVKAPKKKATATP